MDKSKTLCWKNRCSLSSRAETLRRFLCAHPRLIEHRDPHGELLKAARAAADLRRSLVSGLQSGQPADVVMHIGFSARCGLFACELVCTPPMRYLALYHS